MSQPNPPILYSWESFISDSNLLLNILKEKKLDIGLVIGPSRGGLTMGVMFSHGLDKPFIPLVLPKEGYNVDKIFEATLDYIREFVVENNIKDVLIVEDICDSGVTLHKLLGNLKACIPDTAIHLITMWFNPSQTYIAEADCLHANQIDRATDDRWIIFPFETSTPLKEAKMQLSWPSTTAHRHG